MSPRTRYDIRQAREIARGMWHVSPNEAYLWAKTRCDKVGESEVLVFQHLAVASAAVDEVARLWFDNLDVLWAAHEPWMTRTYLKGGAK